MRHGVAGVDHQIHDDLLNLARIGADTTGIGIERDHELHLVTQHPQQHLAHAAYQRVEIEHLRAEDMRPAEGKQLPGQTGRAFGGANNGIDALAHGGTHVVFLQHDFRIAANDHEQVIEVVGNPARQAADRFHLLRLSNLFFEAAPASDIPRGNDDAAYRDIVQ